MAWFFRRRCELIAGLFASTVVGVAIAKAAEVPPIVL